MIVPAVSDKVVLLLDTVTHLGYNKQTIYAILLLRVGCCTPSFAQARGCILLPPLAWWLLSCYISGQTSSSHATESSSRTARPRIPLGPDRSCRTR